MRKWKKKVKRKRLSGLNEILKKNININKILAI